MGATTKLTTVLSLALLTVGMARLDHTYAAVVFTADAESGNLSTDWPNPGQYCCEHSAEIVSSIARKGKYSLKIHRKAGDPLTFGTNRAEVSTCCENHSGKRYDLPNRQTVWIGFSIYFPTGGALGNYPFEKFTSWNNAIQVVGGSATCANAVGFRPTSDGKLYIYYRTSNEHPCASVPPEHPLYKNGALPKGRWIDFVLQVHLDNRANGNGLLRFWQDGQQIVDYSGPIGWPNSGNGYVKFGTYASPSTPATRTLYFDEIRIGDQNSNFAEVSPGISVPASPPSAPKGAKITVVNEN